MNSLENPAVRELKQMLHKHGITPTALAINTKMVPTRIFEILGQRRRITADSDLRFCHFFKLKRGHFSKLQLAYDLSRAEEKIEPILRDMLTVDLAYKA